MTQIDFYQLGGSGLDAALVALVKKTCTAGQKALILCPHPAAVSVDSLLWSHDPDSWLPHGLDDATGADIAPIWISSDMAANPIEAKFVFLLHGSRPASWDGFTRCFCLFDGGSEAQLSQARAQWKEWSSLDDAQLGYYAQNSTGGWDKKA